MYLKSVISCFEIYLTALSVSLFFPLLVPDNPIPDGAIWHFTLITIVKNQTLWVSLPLQNAYYIQFYSSILWSRNNIRFRPVLSVYKFQIQTLDSFTRGGAVISESSFSQRVEGNQFQKSLTVVTYSVKLT